MLKYRYPDLTSQLLQMHLQDQVQQLAEQLMLPECAGDGVTDRMVAVIGQACGLAQCLCALSFCKSLISISPNLSRCAMQDQVQQLAEQIMLPECAGDGVTDRMVAVIGEACGLAQCLCAVSYCKKMIRLSPNRSRCAMQDQVQQLAEQLMLPECAGDGVTDRMVAVIGEACGLAQCLCALNPLAMLRLQSHRLDRPLEAPEDSPPTHFWDGVLVRPSKKASLEHEREHQAWSCAFVW